MPLENKMDNKASTMKTLLVAFIPAIFTCLLTCFLTERNDQSNRLVAEQSTLSKEQKQNVAQFQSLVKQVNEDISTHDFDAFDRDAIAFRRAVDERSYDKYLGLNDIFDKKLQDLQLIITTAQREISFYLITCGPHPAGLPNSPTTCAYYSSIFIQPAVDALNQSLSRHFEDH